MKRLTLPLVVMTVAFLGNMASGQEAAGIPDEIIKELDAFVGKWKMEKKAGDNVQTGTSRIGWVRTEDGTRFCLSARATFEVDGKTQHIASLLGWNATTKCIEDHGFASDGISGVNTWTVISPGRWQGVMRRQVNGQEVTSEAEFVVKSSSEIYIESKSESGQVITGVLHRIEEEPRTEAKK